MSEQHSPTNGPRFHPGMPLPHGNSAVVKNLLEELPSATPRADATEGMRVYSPKQPVDSSSLTWLGPPDALGGEVLSGEPRLYGRFDFRGGNMAAGLFMATTGLIRVTFPFTEHATILEGEVTLTDESGRTQSFRAGDSYFIRQNQVILWDVKGQHVVKSFFNIMEQ
jgi:uncharacterized cupin superfamily protein